MTSKNQMIIKLANTNQQYTFLDLSDISIKDFKSALGNNDKFLTIDNDNGSVLIAKDKIIAIEISKQ